MANLSLKFGLKLMDDITPNVKPRFRQTHDIAIRFQIFHLTRSNLIPVYNLEVDDQ